MSYEPSHRKPPRQERWPHATPAEGWPPYREDDPFQNAGRAARQGAYQAAGGYRNETGYQQDPGGSGYRPAAAPASLRPAGDSYRHGYVEAQHGYLEAQHGYLDAQDGYDQAADGYLDAQDGYDQAADGYLEAQDGYDQAAGSYLEAQGGYDRAANGYDGARQGYDGDGGYRGDNRYSTADGYGTGAGHGYGGGYQTAGNGHGAWKGHGGTAGAHGPGNGSSYGTDGYPSAGYAGGTDGYASASDGFDGAPDGYRRNRGGYGTASHERPGDGRGHDWDGDEDGYGHAADDFAREDFDGSRDDVAGSGGYPGAGHAEPGRSDPMLVVPDAGIDPDAWQADQQARREAGRRGMAVGAVTGFLAVAVGIGVSTLAAAFFGPHASPAAAMGDVFIGRTPAGLRSFAAQHFGADGHAVLLLGMYAGLAVLAVCLGLLTRRGAAPGVAALAAFSLLAAFVTATRPDGRTSDVAPTAVGGLAAVAALLWLVHASAPTPPPRHPRGGARGRAR